MKVSLLSGIKTGFYAGWRVHKQCLPKKLISIWWLLPYPRPAQGQRAESDQIRFYRSDMRERLDLAISQLFLFNSLTLNSIHNSRQSLTVSPCRRSVPCALQQPQVFITAALTPPSGGTKQTMRSWWSVMRNRLLFVFFPRHLYLPFFSGYRTICVLKNYSIYCLVLIEISIESHPQSSGRLLSMSFQL